MRYVLRWFLWVWMILSLSTPVVAQEIFAPRVTRKTNKRLYKYLDLVEKHAKQNGLPPAFVLAVIKTESNFNPRAKSHAGAMGLMQLMPKTAKAFGVKNPYDPDENIRGGCELLARLKKRFKGDVNKILAAYNAGGAHVRRKGGIPWPKTRLYVARIVKRWARYEKMLENKK